VYISGFRYNLDNESRSVYSFCFYYHQTNQKRVFSPNYGFVDMMLIDNPQCMLSKILNNRRTLPFPFCSLFFSLVLSDIYGYQS
jgi:hypothetical protein